MVEQIEKDCDICSTIKYVIAGGRREKVNAEL